MSVLSEAGVGQVTVVVKYAGMEQTFAGSVNDVWVGVNKFFAEVIPAFDLARKVVLTVDLSRLVEDVKGVIAIAPEGPEVLIPKDKLTDSEALQLYLLAAFLGFRLGKLTRDELTKEELSMKLGKSVKIATTRLGELVKQGNVVKLDDRGFKIATVAIGRLLDEVKAIKSEIW